MTDNTTPAWDGAAEVTDRDGDTWVRKVNGAYVLFGDSSCGHTAAELEQAYGPCTPVEPQPRTLTWRRDGTGCAWWEMDAELVDGRQVSAEFDGPPPYIISGTYRGGSVGPRYIKGGPVRPGGHYLVSVTVVLPEEPDASSWDAAEVVEVDGECWQRISADVWHQMGRISLPCPFTAAQLAARGPVRVVVDAQGKAVR